MCISGIMETDLQWLENAFKATVSAEVMDRHRQKVHEDPWQWRSFLSDPRLFPGGCAPIVHKTGEGLRITPMRFRYNGEAVYPDSEMREPHLLDMRQLTSNEWAAKAFGKNHGVLVLRSFSEWMNVKAMLKNQLAPAHQVTSAFSRFCGYRDERCILTNFTPSGRRVVIIPVLFAAGEQPDDIDEFAVVATQPPQELLLSGCGIFPVNLPEACVEPWIAGLPPEPPPSGEQAAEAKEDEAEDKKAGDEAESYDYDLDGDHPALIAMAEAAAAVAAASKGLMPDPDQDQDEEASGASAEEESPKTETAAAPAAEESPDEPVRSGASAMLPRELDPDATTPDPAEGGEGSAGLISILAASVPEVYNLSLYRSA